MTSTAVDHELPRSRDDEIISEVRALYEERYPVKEGGVFTRHDWKRCRRALDLVTGPRVLEVGVGPGQMFHILSRCERVKDLLGIDISWNLKLIEPPRGELELMNILNLSLRDRSFDTVLCMEVLEHLEIVDFPKALYELRRVCSGTLIMTIPYDEPEPLWHHDRPGGHRQSFSDEKLERFFPRATRHKVTRGQGKWPWVMLVEQLDPDDTRA